MDDTNSVKTLGAVYPVHAVDSQVWDRSEPLITPQQLRRRQLLGLPLVSFFQNPITKQRDVLTDEDLADQINRAIAEVELDSGLTIFPVQFDEKYEYSPTFWESWGYTQVSHRPIASVDKFALTPPTNQDLLILDPSWIEPANFHKGQINICPIIPAISAGNVQIGAGGGSAAAAYITYYFGKQWVPAFVRVTYTCGFPSGKLPRVLNEAIGIQAAINVLGALGATNINNSSSVNLDGAGQSVSNGGPQVYIQRMNQLEEQKQNILNKLKNAFGMKVFGSFV